MSAGDRRGGTSGGSPASCHSRTFGWFQTSCMNRVAASASRGSPRSKDSAKSVRNIDSGGIATSGPRSRINRSIVVPDRSLATMKNGARIPAMMTRSSASTRTPEQLSRSARAEHDDGRSEVLLGLADEQKRLGEEAEAGGFRRDLSGCHPVESRDGFERLVALAGPDDLAPAMDGRASVLVLHGDQLARVAHAGDLARVGRRRRVVLLVEAIHRVGQRGSDEPAG